jgi:hypothetical protein
MKDRHRIPKLLITSALMLLFVIGCSSGATDSDGQPPIDNQNAASLAIGVSGSSVPSDDSSDVTVTASVLDSSNAAIEGAVVRFSTTSGALSAASATTDASGNAEITFRSGLVDKSNRIATITATIGTLTAQVPVQITGTNVSVVQESTTLSSSTPSNLEVFVTDAGGSPIYNAEVVISLDVFTSTGTVSLSPSSGFTGLDGSLNVAVTGAASGTAVLDVNAAGAFTSCTYTVETTGSNILQITAPTDEEASQGLEIGDTLTVTVSDPDRGEVVLSTTLGTLNGSSAVTLDASSGTASATLTATAAGLATIQAYNTDAPGVTDSISVAMFAPASSADQISIQASSTVVALSTAELKNSVELTARVTDASGNPVGNAPVVFSMANAPGGGEKLAPSLVFSDASGYAVTIFTSGSLSTSGNGLTVTAELLDVPGISDAIDIIIGGTSGSVAIAASTTLFSINGDTAYRVPVSVLVSDSNGSPVPGAVVTINLWPRYYWVGNCVYGTCDVDDERYINEDINKNQVLDAGEDTNLDGELTPSRSSAGIMPATIVTDANGVGTFDWIYGKDYAKFITAEIKASTMVLGSETTSTVLKILLPSQQDIDDEVLRGESPFVAPPPP